MRQRQRQVPGRVCRERYSCPNVKNTNMSWDILYVHHDMWENRVLDRKKKGGGGVNNSENQHNVLLFGFDAAGSKSSFGM